MGEVNWEDPGEVLEVITKLNLGVYPAPSNRRGDEFRWSAIRSVWPEGLDSKDNHISPALVIGQGKTIPEAVKACCEKVARVS